MTKKEVLATRLGEMLDMLALLAVANGTAREKNTKTMTIQEMRCIR